MANYKVVNADQLDADLTSVADAIREKTGGSEALSFPDGMVAQLKMIPDLIVNSASGNPITLSDSSNMRLLGLNLYGKTTQDGTPTPEAPVELVSAGDGGSIGVTVAGKNLLDLTSPLKYEENLQWSATDYSIDTAPNEVNITAVTSGTWGATNYTYLLPAGTYSLSAQIDGEHYKSLWVGKCTTIDGSYEMVAELTQSGSATFPLTEEAYISIRFHVTGGTGTNGEAWTIRYYNVQLENGTVSTTYEPYNKQTLTLSTPNGLPGIPVTSGGNYTDETGQQWICDEVDFGRGVYVQRIDRLVLTGNESLGHAGSVGTGGFYCFVNRTGSRGNGSGVSICNYFPGAPRILNLGASSNQSTINTVSGGTGTAFPRMCLSHTLLGTNAASSASDGINAVIAWLKSRYSNGVPVVIACGLETPIETALSAEELAAYAILHTNYPNTTILNDGGAGMSVSYVADTKNYIDNKINAMAAAIVNA